MQALSSLMYLFRHYGQTEILEEEPFRLVFMLTGSEVRAGLDHVMINTGECPAFSEFVGQSICNIFYHNMATGVCLKTGSVNNKPKISLSWNKNLHTKSVFYVWLIVSTRYIQWILWNSFCYADTAMCREILPLPS